LRERLHKINLSAFEILKEAQNHCEMNCRPIYHWCIRFPVVDTLMLFTALYI
jgi:hypothetical protein